MITSKLKYLKDLKVRYQEHYILFANYLLIFYAFFLPISADASRTLFNMILLLFLLSGNIVEKLKYVLKDKVVQAFVLFYFMHIIWTIGSSHFDVAKVKMTDFRYILYIIIYVAVIRKDFIYHIFSGFMFGIFFSEIISYFMLMGIKFSFITYTGHGANVPFMSSFTQYSEVLSISMGILLYGIITLKQKWWVKFIYVLFFISASSNIFIIQSKLGYGLYTISILTATAMIIIKHKKYWMLPVFVGLIIGGYTLAYNLSSIFHERVNGFLNQTQSALENKNYATSTGTRMGYYDYGYDLFLENPIFGLGTGNHISAFLNYIDKVETDSKNLYSMKYSLQNGADASLHSEFLDIILQFGFIGLLIFLNIFYQLFRYPYDDHYMKVVQVIFIVILLAVSTVSLIFLYSKIGKIFTLLATLTLKVYHDEKRLKLNTT
jgi:O-antigen ligase